MSETDAVTENQVKPGRYEIRVKGHLDNCWADWFEGLSFSHTSNGTIILAGRIPDQVALHGLLRNVRDGGMPVLWIKRADRGTCETQGRNQR